MRIVILTAVVSIAFACAPRCFALEASPWDQERVTALAGDLEAAVSGLRDAVRKSPM